MRGRIGGRALARVGCAGLVAAVAAVSAACGGPPQGRVRTPVPDCATGTVFATGTEVERRVLLDLPSNGDLTLLGEAEAELASLNGAVVRVCGGSTTEMERPAIQVTTWSLVSVDGMEAYAGMLVRGGDGWVVEGVDLAGSDVPLADVMDGLEALAGRRVWVAGEWSGERFAVRAWGVVGG